MENSDKVQNINEDKKSNLPTQNPYNYGILSSVPVIPPSYPGIGIPPVPGVEYSNASNYPYHPPPVPYHYQSVPYVDPIYSPGYYESISYETAPTMHSRTSRSVSVSKSAYEKSSTLPKSSHSDNWKHSESRYDRDKDKRSSYRSSSYTKSYSSSSRNRDRSYSPRKSETRTTKREERRSRRPETERDRLLAKWRKNYCETSADISRKLEEMANDEEKGYWIRSSPADVYYKRTNGNEVESTTRLSALCTLFEEELMKRSARAKEKQEPYEAPHRKRKVRTCRHKSEYS